MLYQSKKSNQRGIDLCDFFEKNGYILLNGRTQDDNPAKFTFTSKNGCSVIDLVWCRLTSINEIKNMEAYYNRFGPFPYKSHIICFVFFYIANSEESIRRKDVQIFTSLFFKLLNYVLHTRGEMGDD